MRLSKSYLTGIRLMVQAACSFSVMALCAKLVSRSLPAMEIVFFRSVPSLIMLYYLIRVKGAALPGTHRKLLVLRGISGFIALSLHFYTITRLPLGTAVMLNYTAPFFVVILSHFVLGEKTRPFLIFLILISFSGVYLLVRGDFSTFNPDIFLGLLSAVFAAIAYVTIRSIRHRESPLTIIFYFAAVSTLGSAVWLPVEFVMPAPAQWPLLAGVAVGAFYGQLWLTIALRRAPAPIISPFSYLTPLLSFIYGLFFFGDILTPVSTLGVVLIITGGSLLSWFGPRRRGVGDPGITISKGS